jgi:hypothetical protein
VPRQGQVSPITPHTPVDEDASHLSQTFVSQIESFYQRHPRYARFAKQHPTLNKTLMLTAVVVTLTLPLWLRSLTKVGFKLAMHRLPKPANWQQGGVWFAGLLVGVSAGSALLQRWAKAYQQATQQPSPAQARPTVAMPQRLLLP